MLGHKLSIIFILVFLYTGHISGHLDLCWVRYHENCGRLIEASIVRNVSPERVIGGKVVTRLDYARLGYAGTALEVGQTLLFLFDCNDLSRKSIYVSCLAHNDETKEVSIQIFMTIMDEDGEINCPPLQDPFTLNTRIYNGLWFSIQQETGLFTFRLVDTNDELLLLR